MKKVKNPRVTDSKFQLFFHSKKNPLGGDSYIGNKNLYREKKNSLMIRDASWFTWGGSLLDTVEKTVVLSVGNFSLIGQATMGFFALKEGGCALLDGMFTVNPIAKPLYFVGGTACCTGGVLLLGATACSGYCPPIALSLTAGGVACRQVGKYAVCLGQKTDFLI